MTNPHGSDPDGPAEQRGGAFYDQPGVFQRYQEHRAWHLNPNTTLEEGAFLQELGDVTGARVLDLGCGDGATGLELLSRGCASYLGIDGSRSMVDAAAAQLRGSGGEVVLGDLEEYAARLAGFDLIVSRMALHYLRDIGPLLRRCHQSLTTGGRIVFTVTHPVITSHDQRATTTERRQDWVVDDYFVEGPRAQIWLGAASVWQHRTIETYVSELRGAGFNLTNLRECAPDPERFDDLSELERRRRIPLMLLLAGGRGD